MDRKLTLRGVGIGALSPGVQDSGTASAGLALEFRPIPIHSVFVEALANEFAEAGEGLHQASLIYLGLILFLITFVVLSLSRLMLARMKRGEGSRS